MTTATATKTERPEELRIFVERLTHFMNLWTIYKDLISGHYVPSVGKVMSRSDENADGQEWPVNITMMFVLYAYFYSLVEDSDDGLNGFRVWLRCGHKKRQPSRQWNQGFHRLSIGSGCFATDWDFTGVALDATKAQALTCSTSILEPMSMNQ